MQSWGNQLPFHRQSLTRPMQPSLSYPCEGWVTVHLKLGQATSWGNVTVAAPMSCGQKCR